MQQIVLTANNQRSEVVTTGSNTRRAAAFIGVAAAAALGGGKVQVQYLSPDGTTYEPYQGVGSALTGLLAGECMVFEVVDMQIYVQLIGATGTVSVPVNVGVGTN
jgi:hypothetical protein